LAGVPNCGACVRLLAQWWSWWWYTNVESGYRRDFYLGNSVMFRLYYAQWFQMCIRPAYSVTFEVELLLYGSYVVGWQILSVPNTFCMIF